MNKRIALSALAIMPMLSVVGHAQDKAFEVKFQYVNIRTSPSLDSGVKFMLKKGDKVKILSEKDGWTNIEFNGKKGWVKRDALSEVDLSIEKPKAAPSNEVRSVDVDVLNFRSQPSTSSKVLGVLKKGDKVTLMEESAGWAKVSFNGQVGYISSRYLSQSAGGSSVGVTGSNGKMMVMSNTLNVRKEAKATSPKVVTLSKGDVVTFISQKDGWSYISAGGQKGYVSSYYLEQTSVSEEEIADIPEDNKDIVDTDQAPSRTGSIENKAMNMSLDDAVNLQMTKAFNTSQQSGWGNATREELKDLMNPKNHMDYAGMMQFAKLDVYTDDITANQLNRYLNRYCPAGNVFYNKGQAFIDAAKKNNINVLYLVAHSMIETGYGTSKLACGVNVNGKTVYNFFGIGAVDGNAVGGGSQTAYKNGWTSVEAGIDGAAKWISNGYIHNSKYRQNTLYVMKWNPEYPWHQYASSITWPSAIANKMADIGKYSDNLSAMDYIVPQYN